MAQHDYGRFRVRSFCIYERSVNQHDYLLATRTDTELFTENGGPRDQPFEGLRNQAARLPSNGRSIGPPFSVKRSVSVLVVSR